MNETERTELLNLARKTILSSFNHQTESDFEYKTNLTFLNERAVFVTLHKAGNLRGCIGHMQARMPLYKAVSEMATAAAFEDPRFPSLKEAELDEIEIEISVLSPMERIFDYREIKMGIDGVYIKQGLRSGVYLPQVAIDTGWDLETFLRSLCSSKAGLPTDAYKDPNIEIYIYQVEKFSE